MNADQGVDRLRFMVAAFAVAAVVGAGLAAASAAHAAKAVDRFFPVAAEAGGLGGQFSTPRGVAINQPAPAGPADAWDGWIYVADMANSRIQAFSPAVEPDGLPVFEWAIGRNVSVSETSGDDSGAPGYAYERCTEPSDCQGGTSTAALGGFVGVRGGMFSQPQGIAVDQATGNLYVRDRVNNRVQQFDGDGNFVRTWGWDVTVNGSPSDPGNVTTFQVCESAEDCKQGTSGGGAGQFANSGGTAAGTGIAVAPPSAPNAGGVFVADTGQTVGASGKRVLEFTSAGAFVRGFGWDVAPDGAPGDLGNAFEICTTVCQGVSGASTANGSFGHGHPRHLEVGVDGVAYAADGVQSGTGGNRVMRFDATATSAADLLLDPIGGGLLGGSSTSAMAVDVASGELWLARGATDVVQYDPATGSVVDVHLADSGLVANGLAFDSVSGDLLVSSSSLGAHRVYVADDDGAAGDLDVVLFPPTGVTAHGATFSATIDPAGFPTSYRFEYSKTGVEGSWVAVGPDTDIGSGLDPVDVPLADEGTATGLEACTPYRVRVSATRGFGNGTVVSPELTFVTDCIPPDVETGAVDSASDTVAFLRGEVNPNGSATSYWFEYGTSDEYGQRVPVPAASAGAGGVAQAISERVGGLSPDTLYHYRLVASNSLGTTFGEDRVFATRDVPQPVAGRGYELVSPADKVGGVGVGPWYNGIGSTAWVGSGAWAADRFALRGAYGSIIADGPMAWAHDLAAAGRTPAGWRTSPLMTRPSLTPSPFRMINLRAAAPDLGKVVVQSNGEPLRVFEEMVDWNINTHGDPSFIIDWQGRWEIFGPTGDSQMPTVGNPLSDAVSDTIVSADGTHVVGFGPMRGVLGISDPSSMDHPDLIAGRTVYVDDVSAGISNSFPGAGVRSLVNACSAGTVIPERLGSGLLRGQACPAPAGPPDQALISRRGAALQGGSHADISAPGGPLQGVISRDGSRIFFMAPDPEGGGAQNSCNAALEGPATECPPQLYVRQRMADGTVLTRWISRAEDGLFGAQQATLTGPVRFEGAAPDGSRVFFRTSSPLTADDPNGGCGVPCTTGSPSNDSWDLYMYELPADMAADPAGGTLTRITRGPTGESDPNGVQASNREQALLRFAAEDGRRAYVATAGTLEGVDTTPNGSVPGPGGGPSTTDAVNLYLWEQAPDGGESWRYVTRLPRATGADPATCASTGSHQRAALAELRALSGTVGLPPQTEPANCVRGTADGAFVTWWTPGALTADDPDGASGDVYGFDADTDELVRLSRPQGGDGQRYRCSSDPVVDCFGDGGYGGGVRDPLPFLGVAVEPGVAGDRVAFFQSRSRLTADDTDDAYDVYEWRNGDLRLLTGGDSSTDGAFYKGNDRSGRNVYFASRDSYSWEDHDAVLDVYVARTGGGFAQPPPPVLCGVLTGGCHGAGASQTPFSAPSTTGGGGDATPAPRLRLRLAAPAARARARAARGGAVLVRVRASAAGRVRLVARARVGRRVRVVGRAALRVRAGRPATARLRLSRPVLRRLRAGRAVTVAVQGRLGGARPAVVRQTIRRPR